MMPKKELFDAKKIEAYALANAISHEGKAQVNAVLPKLFQEGLQQSQIKEVMLSIQKIVKQVNAMNLEEQKERFQELSGIVKKREARQGLPELQNAVQGKIVMRFAPFPSGPLHIGNARPVVLNDEYCKMYKGKLLLVIDDTIGSEEKIIDKDAYKLIPESLEWLHVKYEKPIIYKSARLDLYYKYAEEMIKKNKAYVCFCTADVLHKNREHARECEHRGYSSEKNLGEWRNMLAGKYKPGQATLRIKTSMQDKNPAFRDRVLFRLSSREHPRTGSKYKVWPLLEFSWAIDDHELGMTHVLRGKDLMMESEMEKYIWNIFGWKPCVLIHTGLFSVEGAKISKSKSQKEVKEGKYIGWDDPRTWSLQSLMRRGIRPEAIRAFCLASGLTQTEATVPVENLYKENKKFVESSNRYFFVANPVKITVKSAPNLKAQVPLHPDHKARGCRIIDTNENFYIAEQDYKAMEKGRRYRLMNLLNFAKDGFLEFISKEHDPKLEAKMIHWLPQHPRQIIKCEVLMPDASIVKGFCEKNAEKLKQGDICQFERFGFCRLDSKTKDKLLFWFAHK